jgi:signal transduction histidine kinase/FixJ family two-component response regulator
MTMSGSLRVLFVYNREDRLLPVVKELRNGGFTPSYQRVNTESGFRTALRDDKWDIVIAHDSVPQLGAAQALAIHEHLGAGAPFILVSESANTETAVESIKAGASDFLMEGNLLRLVPAVQRALLEAAARRANRCASAAQNESEAMLGLIYNSTLEKLVLFAALPDSQYRVASANRAFVEFARQTLGFSDAPDLSGKRLEEIAESIFRCSSSAAKSLRERCDAAFRNGQPMTFDMVFLLPTRKLHAELTLVPVASRDAFSPHLLFACRDITARKDTEDRQRMLEVQLQKSRRLEALGQLAGGIAHDFNNLLTGILGHGELIKADLDANSTAHGHVSHIVGATLRARDLIRQILAFSRREAPDRKPVYVEPIVREALNLIRVTTPFGIAIETSLKPNLPAVLGDASQLHQVLVNLCTNAVQAMGEHGKMTINLEDVEVEAGFADEHPPLDAGAHILLTVSDTGAGISEEAMEHLFEPFFSTKPIGAGSGLGLAVVHGIVRNHQGAIDVSSRPDEGTTFQVYLPVSGVLPDSRASTFFNVPRGSGEMILYVDDEVGIVNLASAVLAQIGYQPRSFTCTTEALAAFQERPHDFAAVITDLTMPSMTGTELRKQIHAIRPEIPVILTSGYSAAIDEGRAARSGFVEILAKPFPMRTLAETLHRVLHEEPEASSVDGSNWDDSSRT